MMCDAYMYACIATRLYIAIRHYVQVHVRLAIAKINANNYVALHV